MSIGILSSEPKVGLEALQRIRRRYAGQRSGRVLLPALAALLLLALVALRLPQLRWLALGGAAVGAGWLTWQLGRIWRLPAAAIARLLDRRFPQLEDSTGLLLRPAAQLNLLEQLQQRHVAARLADLWTSDAALPVRYQPAALLTAGLLALSAALWVWPSFTKTELTHYQATTNLHFPPSVNPKAKPVPAKIIETRIRVVPPAYTRQAAFTAAAPSFTCPQGARAIWTVRVSRAAGRPLLVLNGQRVEFQPVAGQPAVFSAAYTLTKSALYQIRFAGQTSTDYAVEVRPDRAPVIRIRSPRPYTLVEFGQKPEVAIQLALSDDYGLTRAQVVTTIAQGQGEAVKFREVVAELPGFQNQPIQHPATHRLRLSALGLTYGDELYFYVRTWDNARHDTRSDTYLVQWEDTTVTDAGNDMAMGVNVMPAYFRSQRQVIIDTEKLLAERRQLTPTAFADRANALGHDQKVLRLRYGKFLGEEFAQGIGQSSPRPPVAEAGHAEDADYTAADEDGHDHSTEPAPSGAAPPAPEQLLEPYLHRHDDSETADFLEPAVKAKLRGVLGQMWEAELRLRTVRPAEALPYEYRALRLLKQVQQQTRAYVKKSGFDSPVIPEATVRLTGELAGAAAPRRRQQLAAPPAQPDVRAALTVLSALRRGAAVPPTKAAVLERAGQQLAGAALARPGRYLAAIRQLRQLSAEIRAGRPPCLACAGAVEAAFTGLLPVPPAAPARPPGPDRLARRYFQELSR
ncbi:hypothetical protein SAMN02745146_2966 [Hymenobacter daecheongensis DSM 21074]|uniref:DUF4175 domain-containing protein n=1 Tax=Hymenobacter daecheongensis DSM 21074 TaxID=1121955 RepID=A0A1M6ITL3_9BACT|nr:DUF4175 family protein [Hymenobacter daecheongensis]SHJ37768.1 hypothetical protein SAMN02745146_2966 [Hymenobacter daecheongensis DSM 21074]